MISFNLERIANAIRNSFYVAPPQAKLTLFLFDVKQQKKTNLKQKRVLCVITAR